MFAEQLRFRFWCFGWKPELPVSARGTAIVPFCVQHMLTDYDAFRSPDLLTNRK